MVKISIWIRNHFYLLFVLLAIISNRTGNDMYLILTCILAVCMVLAGIQQKKKPALFLEDAIWKEWAEQRLLPEEWASYVKGQGSFLVVYGILGLICGILQYVWGRNVGVVSIIALGVLYFFWELKFFQRKGTEQQKEREK